jgi:hypothetical protein
VGDVDLKMISAAKNSKKFKKIRFWKEKSVEDMVPLGPMTQATLKSSKIHTCTYKCKCGCICHYVESLVIAFYLHHSDLFIVQD